MRSLSLGTPSVRILQEIFVRSTSNMIALVDDEAKFLETVYTNISDDGKVKAFVPF